MGARRPVERSSRSASWAMTAVVADSPGGDGVVLILANFCMGWLAMARRAKRSRSAALSMKLLGGGGSPGEADAAWEPDQRREEDGEGDGDTGQQVGELFYGVGLFSAGVG